MIFVIIIAHAAHKSQHNFRFFRPAAADERLPLTSELSAKLTEGETPLDFCIALKKCKPSGLLSLRQNLRFCHLPRQREALDPRIPKASPMRGRLGCRQPCKKVQAKFVGLHLFCGLIFTHSIAIAVVFGSCFGALFGIESCRMPFSNFARISFGSRPSPT